MKLEDLEANVKAYETVLKEIDRKRELWQTETKSLIKNTLDEIKNLYKLYWHVQVLDITKNSEGVNITFGKTPSGIFEQTERRSKMYVKNGGTIVFSQAYNGDICYYYLSVNRGISNT